MKKVSIIVPVYNEEATIVRCIDSLLAQTYSLLEILVIDDGSCDKTRILLEQYGGQIVLLSQQHRGVASARNAGLLRATGDFILFVDGDDYLEPDCVEQVLQKQQKSGADIVRFSYRLLYPDGHIEEPLSYFRKNNSF